MCDSVYVWGFVMCECVYVGVFVSNVCVCVCVGFVVCVGSGNMCTGIFCVLYCLYCVFNCFVYVFVFLLIFSILPPRDTLIAVSNNNNNSNPVRTGVVCCTMNELLVQM
jgi:hypothetical protein